MARKMFFVSSHHVSGLVTATCICLVAAMIWCGSLAPIPERFAEASAAFLYSTQADGQVPAGVAVFLLLVGLAMSRKSLRGAKLALGLGALCALVAALMLPQVSYTYAAVSDTAVIRRDWSGKAKQVAWSSLHHLELYCSGVHRRRASPHPALLLRFVGARSVNVLGLRAYKISKTDALMRVEELRVKHQAPMIWRETDQQEWFDSGDADMTKCVKEFLDRYPPEKQNIFLAMLRNSSSSRNEILASYR